MEKQKRSKLSKRRSRCQPQLGRSVVGKPGLRPSYSGQSKGHPTEHHKYKSRAALIWLNEMKKNDPSGPLPFPAVLPTRLAWIPRASGISNLNFRSRVHQSLAGPHTDRAGDRQASGSRGGDSLTEGWS